MSSIVIAISFILGQAIFGFLFLKLLPLSITKYVEKEIERASDLKLESARAENRGAYTTLKTSVDLLSVSNSGLHPHIISTSLAMWGLIVDMRHAFSGIVLFDQVTLPDEAISAFKGIKEHENFLNFVSKYQDEKNNFFGVCAIF